jgi:hypothetical protein
MSWSGVRFGLRWICKQSSPDQIFDSAAWRASLTNEPVPHHLLGRSACGAKRTWDALRGTSASDPKRTVANLAFTFWEWSAFGIAGTEPKKSPHFRHRMAGVQFLAIWASSPRRWTRPYLRLRIDQSADSWTREAAGRGRLATQASRHTRRGHGRVHAIDRGG